MIFVGTIIILDFEGFIVNLFALTHFRILMISKLIVDFKFDGESELTIRQVSSANNLGVEEVLLTMLFILTRNKTLILVELHNQQAE